MNIRHTFMTIAAVLLTSAALADSSSVTSKKYVDDFMAGYQNKIPGSGADKLMIYDDSDDGIGEKTIVSSLGNDTSATNIPNVGAVKTGIDGKQDTINGTAGYVMMGTGTAGDVGERAIYGATTRYEDSLVTAESVNNGVINAVNNSLRRVNANGEPDDNGTLWEIADTVVALSYLPAGYTQLEWIQSNGVAYIDTGVKPVSDYERVVAKFSAEDDFSGSGWRIFGSQKSGGDCSIVPWPVGGNQNPFGYLAVGKSWYLPRTQSNTISTSLHTPYEMDVTASSGNVSGTYCGDTFSTNYTGQIEQTLNITLFKNNGQGSGGSSGGRLYYFKLWTAADTLAFYGIPAKRDSDGVLGIYNIADSNPSTAFKTNAATTGNFVAGPAVAN